MSRYNKEQLEEVGKILGMPQTKRWKAAQQFALKHNAWARTEHAAVVKSVKEQRKELKNVYGTSEDSNSALRWGMRMPDSILTSIKMFDPEFDRESEKRQPNPELQKEEWRKMMKVFPEYRVLIKI